MRTLTTALAALLAGAGVRALPAQHAHQFELGAFASYTRYDRAFGLDNQLGGGARLGYFFGRVVGAELDIGYVEPNATSGVATAELTHGSGSLVLNVAAGERHLLYMLGGYTRLDFEKTPPYRFTDNAVHGALGDRIFLGSRAALRLEVRAIYAPSTHASFASGWAGHEVGSLGLSVFAGGGPPSDADGDGVPDKRDACPSTPHGATVDPGDARRTPTATASRTASTSAPTRRPARRWMPPAVRSTRTRPVFPTAWTSVPARPAARGWTPRAAPPTGMATACRTAWLNAPTPQPGRWWTPQAARSTATRTASPTAWTSAPTPRPAPRWTPLGAPGSRTRTATAWTTRRTNAPAPPPERA